MKEKFLTGFLIALTCLFLAILVVGGWARSVANKDEVWAHASTRILQDEVIRSRISNKIVDTIFERTNTQEFVKSQLPGRSKNLAPLLVDVAKDRAYTRVNNILISDAFNDVWQESTKDIQDEIKAILRNDPSVSSTVDGNPQIDIRPALQFVTNKLGFGSKLVNAIPKSRALVSLGLKNDLTKLDVFVQKVRTVWFISLFGVIFTLFLSIIVSRRNLSRLIKWYGFGLIISSVLEIIFQFIAGRYTQKFIEQATHSRFSIGAEWQEATGALLIAALLTLLVGVLLTYIGLFTQKSKQNRSLKDA